MKKTETSIDGAYVIQVEKFGDDRGFFMETFNHKQFQEEVGDFTFVQDNHSLSTEGVLRGLHYQIKHCLLYTSPSPRDATLSRMPSSA